MLSMQRTPPALALEMNNPTPVSVRDQNRQRYADLHGRWAGTNMVLQSELARILALVGLRTLSTQESGRFEILISNESRARDQVDEFVDMLL